MISILINGALGKMGRLLAACAVEQGYYVAAGVDRYAAGAKASFPLYESLDDCAVQADVLVDFSRPDALDDILRYARAHSMPLVLATTGYSPEQSAAIVAAAKELPVFRTANMSVGVNVLLELAKKAASELAGFDVEIVEKHHKTKVDAPSGTALLLADGVREALAEPRSYVFGRQGVAPRDSGEIGIHAVRGGSVTGEHELFFLGEDETVTLAHSASSRRIFALGALQAAAFVTQKNPGLYDMRDLLLQDAGVTHLRMEDGQTLVTIPAGIDPGKLLRSLAEQDVNIDMLARSTARESFSFTITEEHARRAAKELECATLTFGLTKLTILGQGMEKQRGIAAGIFETLDEADVHPLLVTSSEIQVSLLFTGEEAGRATAALRARYHLR